MAGDGESSGLVVLLKAGTIGAGAACVLCTPLDVARISAQAAIAPRKAVPGPLEAIRAAAQPSAVKGLWRGLSWSLVRATMSPAAFLLVYEQQKSYRQAMEAGLVARAVQTTLFQPLEFMRTCRQAGALLSPGARTHLDRTLWEVAVSDQPRSLFRGLIPTLARDVSASALLWASYATLRHQLGGDTHGEPEFRGRPSTAEALQTAAMASGSAAFAAVATQPLDVVKTRMQVHQLVKTDKEGYRRVKVARFFRTFRETYSSAGFASFWTGGAARTFSAAACGFALGPLMEYAQVIADDAARPMRKMFILPEDPSRTIVHPRSQREMFIEVK